MSQREKLTKDPSPCQLQEFQILIREDLPVFLLVAGLYEDIEDVENTDGLTFFLRAETIRIYKPDPLYRSRTGPDFESDTKELFTPVVN